jgi:O-antigen/teichoic acid export membrane protein
MSAQNSAVSLRSARAVAGAGAIVGIATVAVNALAYVVPVLAARLLTPAELGALAALLAVGAVAAVVGVGLQTALAVRWARQHAVENAERLALLTAGVTTVALLLATPAIAVVLDVPAVQPALIAVLTFPVILAGRWIGELQGRQLYGRLAIGMVVAALGRYGGVLIALFEGLDVTASLAVGTVTAWACLAALAALTRRPGRAGVPEPAGPQADTARAHPLKARVSGREVLRAGGASIAILAISSADLVLARALLSGDDAGAYAVGSVLMRGALWAPGVLTILALPMIAQARLYAVRITLALTGAAGVALVVAAAAANELAVALAGGRGYAHLSPYAGGFALLGALYALAVVIVNAEIAASMPRPALWLWAGLLALITTVLVVRPSTVGGVLTIALTTAVVTTTMTAVTFKLLRMRAAARLS